MERLPRELFELRICPFLTTKDLAQLRLCSKTLMYMVDAMLPYKLAFDRPYDYQAWKTAAGNASPHLRATLVYVINYVPLAPQDAQYLLQLCCGKYGSLELARLMCQKQKVAGSAVIFCSAVVRGRLEIAQWLVEHFKLGRAEATTSSNHPLRYCCANGYLTVAKWIADRFKLTRDDATAVNNHALRASSENGHLHVVQWLCERFELTREDVAAEEFYALRKSVKKKHMNVAQWLVSHFDL